MAKPTTIRIPEELLNEINKLVKELKLDLRPICEKFYEKVLYRQARPDIAQIHSKRAKPNGSLQRTELVAMGIS